MRVVYVSYDGVADQLGQSQILPYIRGLRDYGHRFELMSFEKAPARVGPSRDLGENIHHSRLRYHHRPTLPATGWDLVRGSAAALGLSAFRRADLVHARSYVAAAMALPACEALGIPLLFDMRGLWVDERVESGAWSAEGAAARGSRRLERLLLRRATMVTVLTNAMAAHLREAHVVKAPIRVIPTCADLERFTPDGPEAPEVRSRVGERRALVYLGAIGPRIPVEALVRFYAAFQAAQTEPSCFLVLSRESPEPLRAGLAERGLEADLVHLSATRETVAASVRCAAAGVFAYRGQVSPLGISPTKLGELLGCGIPCAGNPVGDVGTILDDGVGTRFELDDPASIDAAARGLVELSRQEGISERCREVARKWYALDRGVAAYDALYRELHRSAPRDTDEAWPLASAS